MEVASELVFDIEYKDKPRPENHDIENIKTVKEDKYEEVKELVQDTVWGLKSIITREEFEKNISKKCSWLF
jgi:hypothetical protein